MDEDWAVLVSFLPERWGELASETRALKGLRKDKSVENLLRVLMLHVGCGHSLRESVVRAKRAGLADLSAMALMKRLKKSKDWLHALCVELFREQGIAVGWDGGFQVRAFDATTVKEPGRTGSLWRLHYSVCLPSLSCDFSSSRQRKGTEPASPCCTSPSASATTCSPTAGIRPPRASITWRQRAVMSSCA